MIIQDFQAEQKAWTEKNFGAGPSDHPLLGLFEEFGELCHAELKAAQGIRGSEEQHVAAAKDAVGDIMIYLADYASKRGVNVAELTGSATFGDVQRDHSYRLHGKPPYLLFRIGTALGKVSACHLEPALTFSMPNFTKAMADLLSELATYCQVKGWSLDAIVTETWATVSKRDWTKNKETGAT